MALFIVYFCLLVVLIAVGAIYLQPITSSRHMLNVEWMDDAEKFALITRWGVRG